jgi:hypothetical protein
MPPLPNTEDPAERQSRDHHAVIIEDSITEDLIEEEPEENVVPGRGVYGLVEEAEGLVPEEDDETLIPGEVDVIVVPLPITGPITATGRVGVVPI